MMSEKYKISIKYVKVNEDFSLDLDDLSSKLSSKTKVVSIVGESNLSGMLPDIKEINNLVRANSEALLIIDGAQLVPHRKVDVQDLGIDFLVFSGHKMLGPTGIGVVWGKKELLNSLDPVYGGGDRIEEVHYDKGNGWGHICIETPDVYKAVEDLEQSGAKIISPAKPMNAGTRILAFIEDPDGYVVELNEKLNLT